MFDSFSASGSLVHTPCGPRKSGIPEAVEMPAPVSATMCEEAATQPRTRSMSSPMSSRVELANGSDLDAPFASGRDLGRHLNGFVEIARVEQIEAGELL